MRCWYRGREYVWGGNGVTGDLTCAGPRAWRCRSSVGISGALAVRDLTRAVTDDRPQLPPDGRRSPRLLFVGGETKPVGHATRGSEVRPPRRRALIRHPGGWDRRGQPPDPWNTGGSPIRAPPYLGGRAAGKLPTTCCSDSRTHRSQHPEIPF